jgi:hypothetical protein
LIRSFRNRDARSAGLAPGIVDTAFCVRSLEPGYKMGAWGAGAFDNDDALDWLSELGDSPDFALGRAALDVTALEYLEAPEGSAALAAA